MSDHEGGFLQRPITVDLAVEILKRSVGEAFQPPPEYLPENTLQGTDFRKDSKTGLAIFEKNTRLFILRELGEVLDKGGEVVAWVYDDDNLKEANDKVSRSFGDAVITWGSSYPLHELKKSGISCRVIVVLPEGSPDETIVFFENPSPADKEKLAALNKRLNEKSSAVNLDVVDNNGKPREHSISVSSGMAFSPQDNIEVMRRRRRIGNDGSPNLAPFNDEDLREDLRQCLEGDKENSVSTIIEGLRQIADDRAHDAKAAKQLEIVDEFLETLVGVTPEQFDQAIEEKFGGSRQSEVVMQFVNRTRRQRYLPPE